MAAYAKGDIMKFDSLSFNTMDPMIRDLVLPSPAFKIFIVCVCEEIGATDLRKNAKLCRLYGINHHSLDKYLHDVNIALDEYYVKGGNV